MTAPTRLWVGTCDTTGKRQYTTKTTARKVRHGIPDRAGMSVYQCEDCGYFHLGHRGQYSRAEHRQHHQAA